MEAAHDGAKQGRPSMSEAEHDGANDHKSQTRQGCPVLCDCAIVLKTGPARSRVSGSGFGRIGLGFGRVFCAGGHWFCGRGLRAAMPWGGGGHMRG